MSTSGTDVQAGFQTPRQVDGTGDCYFYHTMELPGLGVMPGAWDLRASVDAYLGNQPFTGKRVVDVGTASGYLSFEMERRGADVVAFDRTLTEDMPEDDMGLVPFARYGRPQLEELIRGRMAGQRRLQNSFWYAHRALQSRVRLLCGTAYQCPPELGEVDYAFFGAVLLHLRDPLLALSSFARRTREKIIISEPREKITLDESPVMFFRPNVADTVNVGTWWYLTPALLKRFLEVLGFRTFSMVEHTAVFAADNNARVPYFTLVASRE